MSRAAQPRLFDDGEISPGRLASRLPEITSATATISECGLYRYDLTRTWGATCTDADRVAFLMLNPSTATDLKPDPTMKRCEDYARTWGYRGMVLVNLFAFRSPDPDALKAAPDPVGPENDAHIRRWVAAVGLVVLGYGAHPFAARRIEHVMAMTREAGVVPHHLQLTKDGHPGHPLFLKKNLHPLPMVIPSSEK